MTRLFEGWLDNATWVILFVLLVPSTFAVTSWNSLPGTRLYGIRLAMENALLAVAPSHQTKGQLYASFTERGARDATRVLSDSGSTVGLTYLSAHVSAAKENIRTTSDPAVRAELARQYIATLRGVHGTLEQQQQLMAGANQQSVSPPPTGVQRTPTPQAPAPVPTPDPVEEIEETQEEIEEAIEELEQEADAPSLMNNDDDDDGNKKDEKEKNKDKDKENNENKGNNNEDKENKDKDND